MNNEIKVILDYLDMYKNMDEGLLNSKDKKLLLDYITNLQTIEKLYDNKLSENKLLKQELTNLQQENHDLKSKLECYENGLYFSSEVDNLQRKLDKAIDYVEKHTIEETKEIDIFANADILLNILQNGDDNNV